MPHYSSVLHVYIWLHNHYYISENRHAVALLCQLLNHFQISRWLFYRNFLKKLAVMSGEDTINKSDFFLREVPSVRIGWVMFLSKFLTSNLCQIVQLLAMFLSPKKRILSKNNCNFFTWMRKCRNRSWKPSSLFTDRFVSILDKSEVIKWNFQDFRLKGASDYEDVKTNLGKKFWLGQSNLVIKGACDFSKIGDDTYEQDRLKQFALMRLERWTIKKVAFSSIERLSVSR